MIDKEQMEISKIITKYLFMSKMTRKQFQGLDKINFNLITNLEIANMTCVYINLFK